jgi:hypothetical protein
LAEFGDLVVDDDGRLVDVDGEALPVEPSAFILVRDVEGTPQVIAISEDRADALLALGPGRALDLPADECRALREAGVVRSCRWGENLD